MKSRCIRKRVLICIEDFQVLSFDYCQNSTSILPSQQSEIYLKPPSQPLSSSSRLYFYFTSQTPSCHVKQQIPKPSIRLHASWQDLTSWQHKSIGSGIPQLDSEGILGFCNIVDVINRRTSCLVDRGADGSVTILSAVDGTDWAC